MVFFVGSWDWSSMVGLSLAFMFLFATLLARIIFLLFFKLHFSFVTPVTLSFDFSFPFSLFHFQYLWSYFNLLQLISCFLLSNALVSKSTLTLQLPASFVSSAAFAFLYFYPTVSIMDFLLALYFQVLNFCLAFTISRGTMPWFCSQLRLKAS